MCKSKEDVELGGWRRGSKIIESWKQSTSTNLHRNNFLGFDGIYFIKSFTSYSVLNSPVTQPVTWEFCLCSESLHDILDFSVGKDNYTIKVCLYLVYMNAEDHIMLTRFHNNVECIDLPGNVMHAKENLSHSVFVSSQASILKHEPTLLLCGHNIRLCYFLCILDFTKQDISCIYVNIT